MMRKARIVLTNTILLYFGLAFVSCTKDEDTLFTLKPPIANAGESKTVQLPADSVVLTGTATPTGFKIVGYLWAEVSGPNTPVIATQAAATTMVKGLQAGTYVFQFTVFDSLGLSGTDTVSVIVKPVISQTITLQPGNSLDNMFSLLGNTDVSSPNSPELDAAAWTVNSVPVTLRSAFRMDLSSLPAGAKITSAKLTLYSNPKPANGDLVNANAGTNNAFYIQRLSSTWSTSTNWFNQPAPDTTGQVLIPHTDQHFLDLVDVDVTTMVNSMFNNGNYGFILKLKSETPYNIRNFCSSRNSDSTKHPKLVITFTN